MVTIQLDQVTAGYNDRPQIRDINLTIADGDFLGITGPNGGGKTTLLRVILGLLKPMKGSIRYTREGQEVKYLRMGYLPQFSAIDRAFPITVEEMIMQGLQKEKSLLGGYNDEQRRRCRALMEELRLQTKAPCAIRQLSGGELQRVLFARAVIGRPEVLVLDEPNTYFDKQYIEEIYQHIEQEAKHSTVIMVSHDTDYIEKHAKRIITIQETLEISR